MIRTLRRWLALSFAVVLAISVIATCVWSWYDFRNSTLEDRKTRAMDCAALTSRSLNHSGFGNSHMGFGMSYAFDRDPMRKLCQVFEMDYLYVYLVAEDRQSITYLVCVASDDKADQTVLETRAPGTVIEIQLEKDEHRILDGELDWLRESKTPLLLEFYAKSQALGLRPKTIVDYTREPFLFAPGNVRVTLDHDIRTGMRCTDFLDPEVVTVPAGGPFGILEVKWDAFLPDVIRDLVQLPGRRAGAFSKYAACRIYG